jgi:hypothetical protein
MQRAVALAGTASSESGLSIGATSADPAATFLERVQQLPPARRRALVERLGGLIVSLLAAVDFLVRARAIAAAIVIIGITLAVYELRSAVEEIDGKDE